MNVVTKTGTGYKVATLDTLSPSQIDTIRNLPPHEDFVAPVVDARRPASMFLDKDRYDLEMRTAFRSRPVPLTVSVMLPDAGTVLPHDGYGIALLITRDKDGKAHVFLNACQHKGAMLVNDCEVHKLGRLTCPYHAWTFALDGKLIGVPRAETFAGLDKSKRNLKELPCMEAGGLIWAILDPNAEADFSSIPDQVIEDLDALSLADCHMYGDRVFDVKANWKLVLEPFLEGYHVQRLHAATVGPLFADGCSVIDHYGPHVRQISGKIHFKPELLEEPGKNIHSLVTITYQIFPNLVVITSPYYISIMIIMPDGPHASKVHLINLTLEAPSNPKAEELYARSWSIVQDVFGKEDYWAAEISQKGLLTGAVDEVVYGGLEEAIVHFYESLDTVVAA